MKRVWQNVSWNQMAAVIGLLLIGLAPLATVLHWQFNEHLSALDRSLPWRKGTYSMPFSVHPERYYAINLVVNEGDDHQNIDPCPAMAREEVCRSIDVTWKVTSASGGELAHGERRDFVRFQRGGRYDLGVLYSKDQSRAVLTWVVRQDVVGLNTRIEIVGDLKERAVLDFFWLCAALWAVLVIMLGIGVEYWTRRRCRAETAK
jgi:hypothetical protein